MPAQTVLEELTQDELTKDHVERRVEDWVERVEQLYRDIKSWLPAGWTARRGPSVTIREPLMEKFSIPAREKDSLELLHDGEIITEVWPYGLWIIGANGRLDLVKGNDIYVVTDQAKTFEAPEWKIADACSRRKIKAFDRSKLNVILDS